MHGGYYEVSATDLHRGQCCWGRGTHRAGAAWGGGLGNHPASLGQTLSQRCSQSCPRTAPSLTPRVSLGCRGRKRGAVQLGQAKLFVWEKAPLPGPGPGWSPHRPRGPRGAVGWGASGNQPRVGARGKGPADVPPGRTHTHLSDQTSPASPTLGCNQSPRTGPQGRAPEHSWSLGTEVGLAEGQAEGQWDHTALPQTCFLGQPRTGPMAQPHCTVQAQMPHPQ